MTTLRIFQFIAFWKCFQLMLLMHFLYGLLGHRDESRFSGNIIIFYHVLGLKMALEFKNFDEIVKSFYCPVKLTFLDFMTKSFGNGAPWPAMAVEKGLQ